MKKPNSPGTGVVIASLVLIALTGLAYINSFPVKPAAESDSSKQASQAAIKQKGALPPEVELVLNSLSAADREKIAGDPFFRQSLQGQPAFIRRALALSWVDGLKDNFCRGFLRDITDKVYDVESLKNFDLQKAMADCPQGKPLDDTIIYVNKTLRTAFHDLYDSVLQPRQASSRSDEMSGTTRLTGRVGLYFYNFRFAQDLLWLASRLDEPVKAGAEIPGVEENEKPPFPELKFNGLVYHVTGDSPAYKAGIRDGDYILKINDEDVVGQPMQHVTGDLLPGKPGSSVKLTVKRGEQIFERTVTRNSVGVDAVWLRDLGDGIYSIVIREWRKGVHDEVYARLKWLRANNARGIVLDLRGNTGGLWDEAVVTSSYFVKNGVLATLRERVEDLTNKEPHFSTKVYERREGKLIMINKDELSGSSVEDPVKVEYVLPGEDGKKQRVSEEVEFVDGLPEVVVISDGMSASASEVSIGALSRNYVAGDPAAGSSGQGARHIGVPTFGKGIAQSYGPAPLGTGVSVTSGHFLLPDGFWTGDAQRQRHPIKPEKVIGLAEDADYYTESDAQMNYAIDLLKGKQH